MTQDRAITPVILCGGSGTRLWPLSRRSYPKQFSALTGETSLFQASAQRLSGPGYAPPMVLTNADFRFIVTQQLSAVGIDPGAVLIEPEGRNTGPALLAAALYLAAGDPQALMLAAPSDHLIPDGAAFRAAVDAALPAARDGQLVTFGIRPDRAETGYGYLQLTNGADAAICAPTSLERFVEKPDLAQATQMVADPAYLWNAGIFLFTAQALITAFQQHAPDALHPVRRAVEDAQPDLGFVRLAPGPWSQAPDISIDYAIMERAPNLSVVPFAGGWTDLGDWEAVWRMGDQSVVTQGEATAIDCENTLLRSEGDGQAIVGLGLDNIIAVAMPDAVLVASKDRAQDVKRVVTALRATQAKQADQFPKDHRPWGHFETLALADRFQVKRIVVNPGAQLSLQSHMHRSEHWIVVAGTARVTVDDNVCLIAENQSIYVPLGAKHRMENPGKVPMVLIEVQTGTYLGEDDIIRFEDLYARVGEGGSGEGGGTDGSR